MTRRSRFAAEALAAGALLTLGACGKDSAPKQARDTTNAKAGEKADSGAANNAVKIEGDAQRQAGIRVADVQARKVPERLTAAGQITVNEDRTAHVGTYTDGRITEVLATTGDFVKKGQTLARMHSHALHETRAAYETALAGVGRSESALAYAQRYSARMHKLLDLKSASLQEVEKSDSDVRTARTNLETAKIDVVKEREHLSDILRVSPSQLAAVLTADVDLLPILSPITGTVLERKVTAGTVVQPGEETFTVADLSSVWMLASVNENDMAKLRTGARARLLTQAYPEKPFLGIVTRIGSALDPQTRTLPVRITIANPRRELKPQMYANAQIDEGSSRTAIFIPEAAIQDINGSAVVFLRAADGRTFTVHPIEISHALGGEAEVRSGLKPGDNIVTAGSFVVKSEMLKSRIGE